MQDQHTQRHEHVSSFSQPGLVLPTQSIQNQIHELAKTLPPPRKQNTACDACRSRKVKCNRLPGQDKCQHCLSKNYPCTHYVQQATSEKKRNGAVRRPRHPSTTSPTPSLPSKLPSPSTDASFASSYPYSAPRIGSYQGITTSSPTTTLLACLFAPPEARSDPIVYNPLKMKSSPYADWGEMAGKLEEEAFRIDIVMDCVDHPCNSLLIVPGHRFALDLVEVYFQIVHTRLPMLNPLQFRDRLNLRQPTHLQHFSSNDKSLHPATVATVLAWGAKFSEHPLLVLDRRRNGGQSRLAKTLIDRARELAESLKVHREPSPDNVVICLLIEPLQNQTPANDGFHGFWLNCGIRNLLGLQVNHRSVMSEIKDSEIRGSLIFAWWMACLADAYSSFYYRRKPMLDDDDYDLDFYTADPIPQEDAHPQIPSPREQLEFLGYYRAAHALARISRQIARQLWKPSTEPEGIPLEAVTYYVTEFNKWRDLYLPKVGVPSNFEAEWDFVSAVSACASDATYHVMWILLFNALDEFGIRDNGTPDAFNQIDHIKRKVADQALHAGLRIAGLAGVLTSNGYLKLDPAVMHVSCINAGHFLARCSRPEVQNCIAALEQYSYAYEESGDHAMDIKKEYAAARAGDVEFAHMSGFAPRPPTSDAMSVDSIINGSDHTYMSS